MTTDHVEEPVVLAPPSPTEIRAELERMLLANILGPAGGENEGLVTDTAVREYYLVGMLAPRRAGRDPSEFDGQQDELSVEGSAVPDDTSSESGTAPGPSLFPSSLGMTFGVSGEATEIELDARWGRYERVTLESDGETETKRAWRRHPAGGACVLTLQEGTFGPLVPDAEQ